MKHSHYETYNYTFTIPGKYRDSLGDDEYVLSDDQDYLVPLYSAIEKEYFEVANEMLKERKADINYEPKNRPGDNMIVYLLDNGITMEQIKFMVTRGFSIKGLPIKYIHRIMMEIRNIKTFFKVLFQHYIFDTMFILEMLMIYKSNGRLSDEQLDRLIRHEKSKIKINDKTYTNAMIFKKNNIIPLFMDYDSDPKATIIDRMHRLHMDEICLKEKNSYTLSFDPIKFGLSYVELLLTSFLPSALDRLFWKASRDHTIKFYLTLHLHQLFKKTSFHVAHGEKGEHLLLAASRSHQLDLMALILTLTLSDAKDPKFCETLDLKHFKACQTYIKSQTAPDIFESFKQFYQDLLDGRYCHCHNDTPLSVASIKDGSPTLFSVLVNLAIKTDHVDLVHYLVEHPDLQGKINLNRWDQNGDHPLLLALSKSKTKEEAVNLLQWMMEHGAQDTFEDPKTGQPLSILTLALQQKSYLALRYLLKNSKVLVSHILHQHQKSYDPLSLAVMKGDLDKVKLLVNDDQRLDMNQEASVVKDGNHALKINDGAMEMAPSGYRFTPLTLAYLLNEKEIFQYLLDRGWPVQELDDYAYSLLHFMVLKDDKEGVTKLIQYPNANIHLQRNPVNRSHSAITLAISYCGKEMLWELLKSPTCQVNTLDDPQETILIPLINSERISLDDKLELIPYLIEKGLEVNGVDQENGIPALVYAMALASLPLVKCLLEGGADVNFVDDRKNTPLHYAIQMKNEAMASLLLDYGADVNFVDIFDVSLLTYAVKEDYLPMISLLMERGADVNIVVKEEEEEDDIMEEDQEQSLFFMAIDDDNLEVVQLIVEHGLVYDFKNEASLKELMHVLFSSHYNSHALEILIYLLDTGKLDPRDLTLSCLAEILFYDGVDVLKVLVQHGLDITMKDEDGRTIAFLAKTYKKTKINQWLSTLPMDLTSVPSASSTEYGNELSKIERELLDIEKADIFEPFPPQNELFHWEADSDAEESEDEWDEEALNYWAERMNS